MPLSSRIRKSDILSCRVVGTAEHFNHIQPARDDINGKAAIEDSALKPANESQRTTLVTSKCNIGTTVKNIKNYIRVIRPNIDPLNIAVTNRNGPTFSSLKLSVLKETIKEILLPNIWLIGMRVKFFREQQRINAQKTGTSPPITYVRAQNAIISTSSL